MTRKEEIIEQGVDEILLSIDNNRPLYGQKIAIYENLSKKKKKKTYKSEKAEKAFLNLTTDVGRKMNHSFSAGFKIPTESYRIAAKEMVARFEDEYKGKEYDFMR